MAKPDTTKPDLANAEQALRRIKERCAGERLPHWKDDWATTHSRGFIMDVVDGYFHRKENQ
jgi:hypothetical protein